MRRVLLVMLALVAVEGLAPASAAGQTKTVLASHWGDRDFPATPIVNAALRDALTSIPDLNVDYFAEYLETDSHPSAQTAEALAGYIYAKYRGRPIDLVIAVADPALEFVLEHRAELFPDAPIVYSGVGNPAAFSGSVPGSITGVLRSTAYPETLRLILELHPSTERVFVVATSADSETAARVRDALREASPQVPLTFLEDRTVDSLLASVKAIPSGSVLLFITYSRADLGSATGMADIVPLVTAASPVPVYGTNEDYVGRGVIGGVMRGRVATAQQMASMARDILKGRSPSEIPIEPARLTPIFDWRQVRAHGIQPTRLPADAEIRFRSSSVWESVRGYVTMVAIVFIVQLALIGTLWHQWAQRRRAEGAVRSREATLRVSFERIRRLAGRLIHAQESTRAAIARDLHDDVCQELVAVAIGVTSLKASSPELPQPVLHDELSQLQERTLDIVDRVRRLSHDLHPVTLRLLGLPAALRAHCIEVEKRYDVQVGFHVAANTGTVPPEAALCLFRVAQEALRNGAVHGEARRLDVTLSRFGEEIELIVADDGRGFDPESARRDGSGLGLVSIEERAHLARGQVSITSRLWHGTTVTVRVPARDAAPLEEASPSTLVHVHSVAGKS